jgi:hypothetical protein
MEASRGSSSTAASAATPHGADTGRAPYAFEGHTKEEEDSSHDTGLGGKGVNPVSDAVFNPVSDAVFKVSDADTERRDVPCRYVTDTANEDGETQVYKCDCEDDYVNGRKPMESEIPGFISCDSPEVLAQCPFNAHLRVGCIKSCGLINACRWRGDVAG